MSRGAALLLWLLVLAGCGWLVQQRLEVGGDLRLFMPSPGTPAERLLLQQFGEGPGARVLLVALSGAGAEELAAVSRALRARLVGDPRFRQVANGDAEAAPVPEWLLPWRYLLSPGLDRQPLDTAVLRAALQQRLQDLGSAAAALVEPWIARDPTLEVLELLQRWQPIAQPQHRHGVWFDRAGRNALLLVETRAAGFDAEAQADAMAALDRALRAAATEQGLAEPQWLVTGPGAFSVLMRERTRSEAARLGGCASVAMLLLLALAYRSWRVPLLAALPLGTAALAGLAAVALLFGSVHGITLAFGFTLIGVAQDYPVHLFSHHHPARSAADSVRGLWRTLATGVASTCIAYLSFIASGVDGLLQLAVFTITGLVAAALATRHALPPLLGPARHDPGDSALFSRAGAALARWPRPRGLALLLGVLALAVLALAPTPWWQDSLAALAPVPAPLLERDCVLRAELGAADVRHVLAIEAPSQEALLQASERLEPRLQALQDRGAIAGYDLPSRYLPSAATQRARQARLPGRAALETALQEALAGLPFRPGAFAPFLADVEAARQLAPLQPSDLAGTALEPALAALLPPGAGQPVALATLSGVRDPGAVQALAGDGVRLLDLRAAAESLAAAYRGRVLLALAGALLLLAVAVTWSLRRPARVARVLAPMLLSTLLVVAILHGSGVSLTLFHLVSLVLAAGLGLDYALFVDHAGHDPAGQRRTLHALAVCSASTLLVFALLALSEIPVLRAIGTTVALGVACNLVLALALARPPRVPA